MDYLPQINNKWMLWVDKQNSIKKVFCIESFQKSLLQTTLCAHFILLETISHFINQVKKKWLQFAVGFFWPTPQVDMQDVCCCYSIETLKENQQYLYWSVYYITILRFLKFRKRDVMVPNPYIIKSKYWKRSTSIMVSRKNLVSINQSKSSLLVNISSSSFRLQTNQMYQLQNITMINNLYSLRNFRTNMQVNI